MNWHCLFQRFYQCLPNSVSFLLALWSICLTSFSSRHTLKLGSHDKMALLSHSHFYLVRCRVYAQPWRKTKGQARTVSTEIGRQLVLIRKWGSATRGDSRCPLHMAPCSQYLSTSYPSFHHLGKQKKAVGEI